MKTLIEIQNELKAPKNAYNSFGKYKYRSAEMILESVKPILKKHGCLLTLSDDLVYVGDRFYVKAVATLKTKDETFTVTAYAREEETKKGMDGSQITGTASSYARKYALNGLFLIDDTKDADTDEYQTTVREESDKQQELAEEVIQLANQYGISVEEVCKRGEVNSVLDMPVAHLQAAINWIKKEGAKNNG